MHDTAYLCFQFAASGLAIFLLLLQVSFRIASGQINFTLGRIAAAHADHSIVFTNWRQYKYHHLMHGSLGLHESASERNLDRFSRFCGANVRERVVVQQNSFYVRPSFLTANNVRRQFVFVGPMQLTKYSNFESILPGSQH